MKLRYNRLDVIMKMRVYSPLYRIVLDILEDFSELNAPVLRQALHSNDFFLGFSTTRSGNKFDIVGCVRATTMSGDRYVDKALQPELYQKAWRYLDMRLADTGFPRGKYGEIDVRESVIGLPV